MFRFLNVGRPQRRQRGGAHEIAVVTVRLWSPSLWDRFPVALGSPQRAALTPHPDASSAATLSIDWQTKALPQHLPFPFAQRPGLQ